ncbi:MAG TPA: helix-turn-helix domain-containing protein [Sphingobium sp.]
MFTLDHFTIESATRHVAATLLPGMMEMGDGLWRKVAATRPSLVPSGHTALKLANAACHATNNMLLHALARSALVDEVGPMTEVILATRALVRNGSSEEEVMAGYRLGATYWCESWAAAVDEHCPDPTLSVRVASHGTSFALGWLEMISRRVSKEYRDEAERLAREGSLARATYIRRLLSDDDFDIRIASRDLGYDLAGRHVALVLSRYDAHDEAALDPVARTLAADVTTLAPLIVRMDIDTTFCWIPVQRAEALPALRARVLIGQGRAASGLEGFRRSHREATEAVRIARLARASAGTVTHFDMVELAALCSNDVDACQAFIAKTLGPLAAEDGEMRKLRTTVEAYFSRNSNFRATAAHLGIHHNTVRYRLERVAILLRRPPEDHRLQLELALHLANRLGPPVEQG